MWKDLTLRQRAQLISMGVRAGIGDAVEIRKLYDQQHNEFSLGGKPDKDPVMPGSFYTKQGNKYVHPVEAVAIREFPVYKQYMRQAYPEDFQLPSENWLIEDLKYKLLARYDQLKKLYGDYFGSMSDMRQAAILSKAWEDEVMGLNSIGKGSKFYYSMLTGNPDYKYLKSGNSELNNKRRLWWDSEGKGDFNPDEYGFNKYGEGMSFGLKEVVITAPKNRDNWQLPPTDWEESDRVPGLPPILPQKKKEEPKEVARKVVRNKIPGFDPEALFVNFADRDNHRYKTFQFELDPDKVIQDNKEHELSNIETVGFMQRMQDIQNPEEDDFYVNPMLKAAYGGHLYANGSTLIDDPVKMYQSRSEYDFKKDPYDRVIIPTYDEVFPGTKRFDIADESKINPEWRKKFPDAKVYNWDVYQNWVNDIEKYNKKQTMQNVPNAANWYLDNERVDAGLNPVWKGNEYTNGIISSIRDFAPYAFNKGVEYLIQKPLGYAIDKGVDFGTDLAMSSMGYTDPALREQARNNANGVIGGVMERLLPSYWVEQGMRKMYGDDAMDALFNSEWGKTGKTALDFYVGAKAPGIIKETPQAVMNTVDRGLAHFNKFRPNATGRIVGREMMRDGLEGQSPGLTIRPTVRTKVGDVEVDDPNLMYHLDMGDNIGAFSEQGAYIKNGQLIPGISNAPNQESYSWWNLGKPYTTSINGNKLTRLITTHKSNPNLIQVRSQNYPIGQWNGEKGFVTNSEYVSSKPIDVSNSAYHWDPTYGYRRVQNTPSTYDITNDLNQHLWMQDNFPKHFIIEDAVPRIANKISQELNIPLDDDVLNLMKQEISDYIDNIPVEYKEMDALGTAGKEGIAYKKGIIPTIQTKIHEIMHRVRQGYIEDELAETMPSEVNGKSRYDVWDNDRGQINPERDEIYTNGITAQEADILNDAYSFSKEYIENNPNTHLLREKASVNTELRSAIAEKASKEKGHIVTGKELDTYIDALSNKELFEIMNGLDCGYMQDWLSLVKNRRTSNLNTSFDLFPEDARKVGRHGLAKKYNDRFFSAPVKKALKEVGIYTSPFVIGNMLMGNDSQKAYGGNLFAYGGEDDILSWMLNRTNSTYDPRTGYTVQFAPTTKDRDYQAMSLPNVPIYGQSPNPKSRYINQLADQISRQPGVGNNNDYFRMVNIITDTMKNPKNIGPDGALNQYGWAQVAQQQIAGPGSNLDARKKEAAREIFNTGLQVATLPMLGAGFVAAPTATALGLTGGVAGSYAGSAIGSNFDNPYTGTHYGSEIGGLLGGLTGGTIGALVSRAPSLYNYYSGKNVAERFPYNSRNMYRVVGKEAIDDAKKTGIIRGDPRKTQRYPEWGPFFGKNRPLSNLDIYYDYIIEGTPQSTKWVDAWRAGSRRSYIEEMFDRYKGTGTDAEAYWGELYNQQFKDAFSPIVESPAAKRYLTEHPESATDFEFGTEVFPYNENALQASASNFSYWKFNPLLGWRRHKFSNGGNLYKIKEL